MGKTLNRVIVTATLIAATIGLAGAIVGAQDRGDKKGNEDKKGHDEKKAPPQHEQPQQAPRPAPQQHEQPQQAQRPVPQQREQPQQAQRPAPQQTERQAPPQRPQQQAQRPEPQSPRHQQAQQRLAQPQQQQRVVQQQQRLVQYGARLEEQQRQAPQQAIALQRQNRAAQYGFQLLYTARLRQQQLSLQNDRGYNYGGDPYFYTPSSYRYSREGRYYETNDYGATALRQAINYGYQEGLEAGRADRQDHRRFDYKSSYAYEDANYGYGGFYIERDDYNYYFRQGFRRGYEDGYYRRCRYGIQTSGVYGVRSPVLSVILNLQVLR